MVFYLTMSLNEGENFVTRKITRAAGRIAEGLQDHLELGNMDSLRDWGYAKDYVECMWMILQHETPEDFVIATGEQHTVRDFTEKAFAANGITLRWEGTGLEEKGYDAQTGKMLVCVNPDSGFVRQMWTISGVTRPRRKQCWDGIHRKLHMRNW